VIKQGIRSALLIWLGLVCGYAQAQQLEGIRVHMHGEEGYAADGSVYSPPGDGPFAAIVLVPDERGITQRLTAAAARFVERRFLVVVLDLNRGLSPEAATHSEQQSHHDLDAALSYLTAQPSVAHDAIGLVGWQSGGNCALGFAADPRVKAVELIGSRPPLVLTAGAAKPSAAILISLAGLDSRNGPQTAGISARIKTYPHAHADFDDPGNVAQYRAADAKDLWQREAVFFSKLALTP
jgi:dienelactone hydrolase